MKNDVQNFSIENLNSLIQPTCIYQNILFHISSDANIYISRVRYMG